MRYLLVLLILFFKISFNSYGQFSLESSFNSVHIGRNQNLLLKYQWGRLSINAGLKYNFNKRNDFPQSQGDFYKKAFWAINPAEHWGAELGLQVKIIKKENFDLFGYYLTQISRSHTRHEKYYALEPIVPEPQSEYDYSYVLKINYIGPMWAIENNFGIGLNVYFSKHLYFSTKLGGGIVFLKNLDQSTIIIGGNGWELSEMLSMGIGWRFNKRK